MPDPPPLVAVAHGTRVLGGEDVVRELLDRVRAHLPGTEVAAAFVDVGRPTLPEVLARLRGDVVVVPLLLGAGYHARVDIPGALAAAPWLSARVAPALGPDPLLADVLADRLAEAGARPGDEVVLAAAGSSDRRANAAAVSTAGLLARRLGERADVSVRTAYVAGPAPDLRETVARCRERSGGRVAVATYLIAPGRFAHAVATAGAQVVSAPLGVHDALVRLIARRYEHARRLPGPIR